MKMLCIDQEKNNETNHAGEHVMFLFHNYMSMKQTKQLKCYKKGN